MATAIDLADMKSPNGGIHPRLKQEVGRRLALTARAVQYLEDVQHEGPRLEGLQLSPAATEATLTFAVSTAASLHLSGTAGCVDCCQQPPSKPWYSAFELQAPNGTWIGATNVSVRRNLVSLSAAVPISGVRHGFGGMPDCMHREQEQTRRYFHLPCSLLLYQRDCRRASKASTGRVSNKMHCPLARLARQAVPLPFMKPGHCVEHVLDSSARGGIILGCKPVVN